jgi:SAM-dependent methyltransferase
MSEPAPDLPRSVSLRDDNRRFYDGLWERSHLVRPERFNTWPLVQSLCEGVVRRLEVAPGLRPRLPIADTQFVDISRPALAALRSAGGRVLLAEVSALPFANESFELVCALDIVEHVDDDELALRELTRVARPGAMFLLSTPLHASRWTRFDAFVGHKRRYDPVQLVARLRARGLIIERSAVFGMQPRSSLLLDAGMWWMTHHRERAMWLYNRAFMPLGLRLQRPLQLATGMIPTDSVDEILLVCRKAV